MYQIIVGTQIKEEEKDGQGSEHTRQGGGIRLTRDILGLTMDKQGQTRDSQGQNRDNQAQVA